MLFGSVQIFFVIEITETGEMSLFSLGITQAHAERIIPELDYQYRAIIVIPSDDFRHAITNLQHTGNSGTYYLRCFRFPCCIEVENNFICSITFMIYEILGHYGSVSCILL